MPEKSIVNIIAVQRYSAPCGELLLGAFDGKLCLCDWLTGKHHGAVIKRLERLLQAHCEECASSTTTIACSQLDEYFAGTRLSFDIPLLLSGTDFQKTVWRQLLLIPYGKTISYGDLAKSIHRPSAVRAVANANGANALSIFIPCHRVIGADGSLTGYGGGIDTKRMLLELEHAL